MMHEVFSLQRAWLPDALPQEQTMSQNFAEDEFNRFLEEIKQEGVTISPVKRTMRILKDEDERDYMTIYDQRVIVDADENTIQELKARINR